MITPENYKHDILVLGYIDFEECINESEISKKDKRFNSKGIGQCKIEVYGPNEGSIPHMHIFNKDKSFETCVCIYSNNYYSHGGKYTSKFNSKQCKEFNDWMKQINTKFFGQLTNWQVVVGMWEAANTNCLFPDSRKIKIQPHYENMINFKDL